VIVIAVHAGGFAKTAKYYTTSYTTTAGNDWDGTAGFNISLGAGNPNGMVNRKNYGSGLIQGHSKWSSSVSVATKDPFILKLNVIPSYNAESRMLNTTVKATFKKPYEADTKLCVVLTEDSIIGPQKDYNPELPSDYIAKYVFMHMLRDALNGSWGQTLKTAPVMANDSINISIPSYEVSSTFQDKHLSVVAFVYDATTREVQVEKVKMRN
jgi:hypothetical protein